MTPAAPHRVLVADDVADERYLVRRALERSGAFEVVAEADTGLRAVELAADVQPALALLDLAMPDMDGLQALTRIREVSPDTVVVVLSSFGRQRMDATARHAGAAAYLQKGIDPERLADGLLAIMASGHTAAPEPAQARDRHVGRTLLTSATSSPAQARHFVERTLLDWGYPGLVDTAILLTSELVTNAVMHAESDLELTLQLVNGFLRVEVYDREDRAVRPRDAGDEATSGRGLALVDALATSWGTDDVDLGKVVWFEVPQRPD